MADMFQATTHVKLDFHLFQDGQQINPNNEQVNAILDLFPTAFSLSIQNPLMIIVCSQLPPKPWPLTVAGMPIYITNDRNKTPLRLGLGARGATINIDDPIKRYAKPSLDTFTKVFQALDERNIHLTRLQWVGWRFLGFLSGDAPTGWKSSFPAFINGITMGYIFGEEASEQKALRLKVPAERDYDDATYGEKLRPGIMLAGNDGSSGAELQTTSGICVKSSLGEKYVTCASHGFPGGKGQSVFHPSTGGELIGTFAKQFWTSDIGLFELNPGFDYDRETFSTPEYSVQPFRKIIHALELRIGDIIHLNTPYNGHIEAAVVNIEVLRLPTDEPADPDRYIVGHYVYFGNGSDTLFDGCCGGPIWTDEYDVVGQFRFMLKDEPVGYCPSYDALLKLGYELAEL